MGRLFHSEGVCHGSGIYRIPALGSTKVKPRTPLALFPASALAFEPLTGTGPVTSPGTTYRRGISPRS